jgi:2-keto-4-pentenoate hydratase
VGHLTTATVLGPGDVYAHGGEEIHADAEVAIEIGRDWEIRAYAAALELVDLAHPPDDAYAAVVENVFHRVVAFGPPTTDRPRRLTAALVVNGETRRAAEAADVIDERVAEARRVLAAAGERLEPGDGVITGNVVQVEVRPGDRVEADLGPLGTVWLEIR